MLHITLSKERHQTATGLDRALRQLIAANGRSSSVTPQGILPWITEAKTAVGRNEARDRTWLMDWLKRDGRSLGDTSKNP